MSHAARLTVRAAALTGLAALCRSYRVDAARLLRQVGLPAGVEDQPDRRIPVTAVNAVFIESSNEIGAFESGLVARYFGPVFSVVSGGFGTLAVVAFVAWAFPALRSMRTLTETKDDVRRAEAEEEEHRRLGTEG